MIDETALRIAEKICGLLLIVGMVLALGSGL